MQRARCYLLGERAVVLELEPPMSLESQQRIWGLAERLNHHEEVLEAIPGMNNLTVLLANPQQVALDALERLQRWWEESESLVFDPRDIDIPVVYGGDAGPDLAEVAAHSGLSEHQVVEAHASAQYVVYFLGFQPGFAYLGGLNEKLHMPRRAEPRLRVPAGSVGIGGAQTGIYPLATPGGWQLIGRTSLKLFNPQTMPPTLLRPGDNVRFLPQKEGVC
ncbi:5-oxoprolinase subunit PxpB [Pectobacterium aroidearum]|uniref:5-oxoprolinase subunit PxpB n=1 Tax=Pectobacterium aroidearum TaxID=1201031 RepID=UPI002115BDAF|nr:5-oxoprolinase subunit PxpB [Pectobacterium aroidearum]UUE43843.1 5-oxoprolinase subunit PxpB [Pectobacterium aroidearum]UUE48064.1 5-oxoprolinase subunit PxpB [Pectobacterium aroidearum]UUE52269.1 5-oxoprolinase subunit PxpB [Pectobacterium aroidearum]UUE58861.1 5-oxoprolinase subunit PxpB [Pectobacterium aroidearum]UUE60677.1 5-oxoprolinase subunit PxpB [Pectobacterium aroidearum]